MKTGTIIIAGIAFGIFWAALRSITQSLQSLTDVLRDIRTILRDWRDEEEAD